MTVSSRTFRVFISSTFNDLKAERNALQERVYPRLRDLCQQHGARFQPIDLRWGVSEEASLDQQAMNICLGEIKRCQDTSPRPNFIVLLGNRYGWCPPPSQISSEIFRQILNCIGDPEEEALVKDWYILDENALDKNGLPGGEWRLKRRSGIYEQTEVWYPIESSLQAILAKAARELSLNEEELLAFSASATEQEIAAGALLLKDVPDHVLCFFREITGLPEEFIFSEYLSKVSERVKKRYPDGMNTSCQDLLREMTHLKDESSAEDLAKWIKKKNKSILKATPEEELMSLFWQVLIDYTANDYMNLQQDNWKVDTRLWQQQADLKKKLNQRFPEQIYSTYTAQWTGEEITHDHIDQLCEDVYNSLSHIIMDEIEHPATSTTENEKLLHIQPDAVLDLEGHIHHTFAEKRLEIFVGRTEMLEKIKAYLGGIQRRSLAITGAGGTGKSALIAKAVETAQAYFPNNKIVYRFIGASPDSSDIGSLLSSLCHEISRHYRVDHKDIPVDYRDLVPELVKRLKLATEENPLILFLDSLDQLSDSQNAHKLVWLPALLPKNVKLIVSTRSEEPILSALQVRQVEMETLEGLSRKEGELLLTQWLASVQRTLKSNQIEEILDKFECKDAPEQLKLEPGNPLYLKLAFEEARLWNSSDDFEYKLAFGIEGLIKENMIKRLNAKSNHGEMMVSHALGYLVSSRQGLAEDELVDLLSRDLDVYRWFMDTSMHLPSDLIRSAVEYRKKSEFSGGSDRELEWMVGKWLKEIRNPPEKVTDFLKFVLPQKNGPQIPVVLWSRLSFDLAPYLSEKTMDGSSLLDFYHRELGDISGELFLAKDQDKVYHSKLADFFRSKAYPDKEKSWTGNDKHALSELPYHLIKAERFEEIIQLLTDFRFLQTKLNLLGIQRVIEDYEEAIKAGINSRSIHIVRDALKLSAHVLLEDPDQLGSQLTGRLLSSQEKPVCDLLEQIKGCEQPWLRPLKSTLTEPGRPMLRTLIGHKEEIRAVAVSRDGEAAVSASSDGRLKIWDTNTGVELLSLKLGENEVEALTISDNKHYVVYTTTWGRLPSILNLDTRKIKKLSKDYRPGSDGEILAATSSGLILSSFAEGTLALWDPNSGEMVSRLKPHGFIETSGREFIHRPAVHVMAVAPDGNRTVSVNEEGKITVWDMEECRELFSFRSIQTPDVLTFSIDGRHLVTGTEGGRVDIWNLDRGTLQRTIQIGRNLTGMALFSNGKHLLCGFYDGKIKIYDLEHSQELSAEAGHNGAVQFVTGGGDHIAASFGEDTSIRLWDLGAELSQEGAGRRDGHSNAVWEIKSLPKGKRFVSTSADNTICIWDKFGNLLNTLRGHEGKIRPISPPNVGVTAICAAGDGRYIMTGDSNGNLRFWDTEKEVCIWSASGHSNEVTSIVFSKDCNRAISGSLDRSVKVWEVKSGRELAVLREHEHYVYSLAITPDGKCAISASRDKMINVWDLENYKLLRTISGHSGPVRQIKILPDGKSLISAAEDRSMGVAVWDIKQGEEIGHLEKTEHGALALAVSPDGKMAVSGDMNGVLRIWDLEQLHLVHIIQAHSDQMIIPGGNPLYGMSLAITSDGKHVITTSVDQKLKIWELSTGEQIAAFTTESSLWTCAVAGDALTITAGDLEGRVHFLKLENVPGLEQFEEPDDVGREPPLERIVPLEKGQVVQNDQIKEPEFKPVEKPKQQQVEEVKQILHVDARVLGTHKDEITAITVDPDNRFVFTGTKNGTFSFWAVEKNDPAREMSDLQKNSPIKDLIVCSGRQHLVGYSNNSILIWKIPSGNLMQSIDAARGTLDFVFVTPDGQLAVSGAGGIESSPMVWNLKIGKRIGEFSGIVPNKFRGHRWGFDHTAAAISPDSRWFVAGVKNEVMLCDISSQREFERSGYSRLSLGSFSDQTGFHTESVTNVASSPDGRILASCDDTRILLWDLSHLEIPQQAGSHLSIGRHVTRAPESILFSVPNRLVHTMEFVNNGNKLLCATIDRLMLFDLRRHNPVCEIDCSGAFVSKASVSADGRWVTAINNIGQLRLWDKKTGKPVATFIAESEIVVCHISSDGKLIAAGETSGSVHLVELEIPDGESFVFREELISRLSSQVNAVEKEVRSQNRTIQPSVSQAGKVDIPKTDSREPVVVTAVDMDGEPTVCCPVCEQNYPVTRKMLGKEINCLNLDCQTLLKINVFVSRSPQPKKKKGFWNR